jgi:MoaA/NifB/PqqE/SkfB family radical SAM enzyme
MERNDFQFRLSDLNFYDGTKSEQIILKKNIDNINLGLGLTDRCNLKCTKCYYRSGSDYKSKEMPYSFLKSVLKDIGRLNHICIGLEGEPLCHTKFNEILRLCHQHTDYISIVSNGLLIRDHHLKLMSEINLYNLILSCDGFDEKTYELLHKNGKFSDFISITKNASKVLEDKVIIHSVISNVNAKNIIKIPKFASELGIKTVSLTQLRENNWTLKNGLKKAPIEHLKENIPELMKLSENLGIKVIYDAMFASGEFLEWLKKEITKYENYNIEVLGNPCLIPWLMTSLLCDGRLFACCGDFQPEIPKNGDWFNKLFNDKNILKLRQSLVLGDIPKACLVCRGIK